MTEFHYARDDDGVATITWDVPGRSMNVMSLAGLDDLEALIDRALGDPRVKGVVLTSAKDGFAAGMDLGVIAGMKAAAGDDPAQGLFDGICRVHALFRKIERAGMDPRTLKGGKPIAAALPGTALGLGLELPLACHRIFAADRDDARIGLPEIKVGLFPGAGGTTRVTRKLGLMASAPVLLEGRLAPPKKAAASGLIDEVVAPQDLLQKARAWVLEAKPADLVKPWDQKGWKMPGGGPYHPAGFMTFVGASAMVTARTRGVYPAAQALLSAAYEGAMVDMDTALRIEARHFTSVLMDPTSAAMIRTLFLSKQALEKGARRPKVAWQSVEKLGVLGGGMMGAGIAQVAAGAGIPVVLVDATAEAAEQGKARVATALDKSVSRRRITEDAKAAQLDRITATADYAALEGCDLVIEAVFEDPRVKAEATRKAEQYLVDTAVFSTNTSTLPIDDLSRASARPERFVGLHFFSPVDRMLLVEIIRGDRTGDEAVATALDFVRAIGKTPIVVNDARFFYANRCIIPYLNEGIAMLREGVAPALIENAAEMLGMPLGPLQLTDEVSIALGARIARATVEAGGGGSEADEVIFWLEDEGRLGRKAGAGFYDYDDKGKRTGLWPGLGRRYPQAEAQPLLEEVQARLIHAQVLEAVRALAAGVLSDIREGDVAAILGWGFAPWSGGPFSWLDRIGAARAVAECDRLAARYGDRFAAPDLLRDLAETGESFYGRFSASSEDAA